MKCAAFCPHNAIEAGHSWGVALYAITAFPISAYLLSLLGADSLFIEKFNSNWAGDILNIICFYPAIFVSYYIFSLLIRIPLFNYLFTHTTMTHLSFWGRYKEPKTKLKDISWQFLQADGQSFRTNGKQRMVCFYMAMVAIVFPILMLNIPNYQGLTQRVMYLQILGWLWEKYPRSLVTA